MKVIYQLINFIFITSILFFQSAKAQAPDVAFTNHFTGSSNKNLSDIKVDNFGNTYCVGKYKYVSGAPTILGNTTLPVTADNDVYVVKLDSSGACIWVKTFGSNFDDDGVAIEISEAGYIYILGNYEDSITIGNFTMVDSSSQYSLMNTYIAKLDTSGNFIWAKSLRSTLSNSCTLMNTSLFVDQNENIFITGRFAGTLELNDVTIISNGDYDIYMIKMDVNGEILFARSFGNVGYDHGHSIIGDQSGNLYLLGSFEGPNLTLDTITLTSIALNTEFLAKFNSNGECIRISKMGNLTANWFGGWDIDDSSNLFISGDFGNTLTLDTLSITANGLTSDIFIAKFNADLNINWLKSFGGNASDGNFGFCLDHDGNCIVELDLGTSMFINGVYYDTANGSNFLIKLDNQGNPLWVSEGYNGLLRAIDVDMANNIYIAIMIDGIIGNLEIGDTTFIPSNYYNRDVVVAKLGNNIYTQPGTGINKIDGNSEEPFLLLYPNPVLQNEINANFSVKASLKIFNAHGQEVFEQRNIEGQQKLSLNLKSGIYLALIQTKNASYTQKVIVN